jgi:hypothetical protein
LAAEALHEILSSGASCADALSGYETACRKVFDGSFRFSRSVWTFIAHGGVEGLSRVLPQNIGLQWTGGHRRI